MENATEALAVGINFIVKNFLLNHVGENPKEIKTEMADDLIVVLIRNFLSPAEKDLLEHQSEVASYQQLRKRLFQESEHILHERLSTFLHKKIRRIHYIFGTQTEDMNIVIYLEPS